MEGVTNIAFEPEEEDQTTMGQVVRLAGGNTEATAAIIQAILAFTNDAFTFETIM